MGESTHVQSFISTREKKKWIQHKCDAKYHFQINMFTVSFPNCHVDGLLVPFLPPCLLLLALQGTHYLPSVQEALGLSSGTHCRHSARTGAAGSKSGGTEKISSSWTAAQHYCPLLCHIPWVEDKTPTDTKCSLNVCRAEIMWIHQQCLQECLSSRWVVNSLTVTFKWENLNIIVHDPV